MSATTPTEHGPVLLSATLAEPWPSPERKPLPLSHHSCAKHSGNCQPAMPQVGDKVKPYSSEMVYEISKVHHGGDEVDLHVPGTNLQRFRVPIENITFVERKPPARTSNPFTNPEPVFDSDELLERIATVQEENLKRLDDDIDILKSC